MVILSLKTVQYQNNKKCYEFIEIKNVILIEKLFRSIQYGHEKFISLIAKIKQMVILSLKTIPYQNNKKCYEFIEIKKCHTY